MNLNDTVHLYIDRRDKIQFGVDSLGPYPAKVFNIGTGDRLDLLATINGKDYKVFNVSNVRANLPAYWVEA